jgi:hypothetical protein
VPLGESRTVTLPVAATRALTLTGPVTFAGVEYAAPAARSKAGAAAAAKYGPSGTGDLGPGVLTVGQPAPGAALSAGAVLPLRVTFRPAHAGPVVASLDIPTSAGTRSVAVSAYGSAPGLLLSAPPLDFGTIETRAGGKRLSFTFSNSWDAPERITAERMPRGPYSLSGLPPVGTTLAPRQAVTVSVLFDPARPGRYGGRLAIATDHGGASLPLSGIALSGRPRLIAGPARIDLGSVRIGHSRSALLRVANGGTVPLEITRAIAPLGAFSTPSPLPEGISLDPNSAVRVRIVFAPTARGSYRGRYLIRGDDGRGPVVVTLTGRGV